MRQARTSLSIGRRRQRGVTLIIALIVLIIIGLTSASVMRGALVSDQVANNTRSQTLAAQAADVALRYCERQLPACAGGFTCLAAPVPVPPAVAASGVWEASANWFGVGRAASVNVVPGAAVNSAGIKAALFSNATLPECIAEHSPLSGTTYVVTARGFSPDHVADPKTGKTVAGSVVWVQSIVKF